jgi:hypothetical protein
MIADHVEERLISYKLPSARDRVTVAARFRLGDKHQAVVIDVHRLAVPLFVAGVDHDADIRHARARCFGRDNAEDGLLDSVAVYEHLMRQVSLALSSGGDYGFGNFHGRSSGDRRWNGIKGVLGMTVNRLRL